MVSINLQTLLFVPLIALKWRVCRMLNLAAFRILLVQESLNSVVPLKIDQ